ncbi:MAG: SDR family oxidoreductase [Actinocatenispora sp.]
MSTEQRDRVAIVTGGTRGIGRETAGRLAGDGYAVVLNYVGGKSGADSAVETLRHDGARAIAVQADVADEYAVAAMFDRAEAEYGGVDVVVHAAGIMPLSPLVDLDLAVLDRVLSANVRGTFVVNQQAARRLRPGGAIVNFSSSITRFSRPGYSAYGASKGAVEAVTLTLARELRGRDITVNAVAPGPTATALFFDGKSEDLVQQIANEAPLERLGQPADIAEVVAFLAGPGRWVNGQVLFANGGAI